MAEIWAKVYVEKQVLLRNRDVHFINTGFYQVGLPVCSLIHWKQRLHQLKCEEQEKGP